MATQFLICISACEGPIDAASIGVALGLSLADGKALLQQLQQAISGAQADELCNLHRVCQCCHRWNPIKDYRLRKIDTVFGTVSLLSPRIVSCPCEPPWYLELPVSPPECASGSKCAGRHVVLTFLRRCDVLS
jgi:hypothetical protein